jgi:hypothetical protein
MGCQLRATKEMKIDETICTIPRSAMITPDVIAASDAGRIVQSCISLDQKSFATTEDVNTPANIIANNFWNTFVNTTEAEQSIQYKCRGHSGPQLLVKILQERKRAENAWQNAISKAATEIGDNSENALHTTPIPKGILTTRVPIIAFLIQQRFQPHNPPITTIVEGKDEDEIPPGFMHLMKPLPLAVTTPASFTPYARVGLDQT